MFFIGLRCQKFFCVKKPFETLVFIEIYSTEFGNILKIMEVKNWKIITTSRIRIKIRTGGV